ncbi:MAG: putative toxin-antitoxin system toxin component, PIN family [Actinomycetota bacterium]
MRTLLDTNVLISAILFGGLPRKLLERAIRGEFDLVTSPHLLTELEEVLLEKFGFPQAAAKAIRGEVESMAESVQPTAASAILRDPDNDEVLAAAKLGEAEAIVTGDRDLLDFESYEGIVIITPREFETLLQERD